jgi:hypothetical protein
MKKAALRDDTRYGLWPVKKTTQVDLDPHVFPTAADRESFRRLTRRAWTRLLKALIITV